MAVDRSLLAEWVIEALEELGGQGRILDICRVVWTKHSAEIQADPKVVYRWQYEIRWSGNILRKDGRLLPADQTPKGVWELS